MENKDETGVVVPFAQDAEFFYRCACRYLEEDNLLTAVQYAQKAYRMAPDDIEYAITFAEILNQMHRYEESAQVLLLVRPYGELPDDALFGLASDFMGLEEFDAAAQCAKGCIDRDPDGPYADRAADLLDLLEDHEDLEIQIGLDEGEDCKLLEQIRTAKAMHVTGADKEALALLESLTEAYPTSDILDMEVAMMLYTMRAYQQAEQRLYRIFKRNSRHIRAHLLMALLYHTEGREHEAREELERTVIDPDASPEELGYAGAIFIEFDEIDRAIDSLERLREFLPFDKDMLHQLGYCYLKKGRREQAEQTYRMLLESDESDTVAAYYENAIRTTEPDDFLRSWSLHYDVPMYEFLKRQRRLQQVAEVGIEAVKELWQNDPSFHDLLRWALFSQLVTFRKAIVRMLAIVGDEEAQKLLRRFLITYDQSDEEKQFVFGTLLSLEAKPPFALYMGGQWQYGAVQPLSVPEKLPRSYAFVLWNIQQVKHKAEAFDQKHGALVTDHVIEVAIRIFLYFTASLDHRYPRLTPAQENAMSAAFVLLALSSLDLSNIPPDMLCDWYGISRRRLENALQKIFRQLQKEKES